MKIVCAILSYKMADLTDRTVGQLIEHGFERGENLFVFENSHNPIRDPLPEFKGDPEARIWDHSKYVTHFTGSNLRMTGGFNHICDTVAKWPLHERPDVLWLCTNDFEILEVDRQNVRSCIERAFGWPGPRGESFRTGWWHPSLEPIPGYAYPWMFQEENYRKSRRKAWMTDFICPAIRWDLLQTIKAEHGHWFDPRFYRGWGIDYETCFRIRALKSHVVVDDYVKIRHEASKTYTAGAAPESKDEFYSEALKEMHKVMLTKYGPGWLQMMQEAK